MRPLRQLGRYSLYDVIAEGGMATVSFGRLRGGAGFSKIVAIKTLHAELSRDREFVAMFLDEVRIAARLQHPNIVSVLDVVQEASELFLVMEYVEGEVFSRLLRTGREQSEVATPSIAGALIAGVLRGLHMAHEAVNEDGEPLNIIHRDVSPHNIMIGCDGIARVLDFGVAKVSGRLQSTQRGHVKGKLGYMAPEQVADKELDRRADIYACGVVLYEALTGEPLRSGGDENTIYAQVVGGHANNPSDVIEGLPDGADEAVMKALALDPDDRFETAAEMADELDRVFGGASPREIGAWVEGLASENLSARREVRRAVESDSAADIPSSNPESILDSFPTMSSGPTSIRSLKPGESGHSKATVPTVQSIPARALAKTNRILWLLAGAALMVGGASALFLFKTTGEDTRATGSQQPVESQPVPLPGRSAVVLPVASVAQQVDQEPPSSTDPTPTSSAPAPSTSTSAKPPSNPLPAPRKIRPRATPPSQPDCNPPYVITKDGARRYKSECL